MDILLYTNINSLYESWDMRLTTALFANKAISRKRAINPSSLPTNYNKNIPSLVVKELVKTKNGFVYLTTRGCMLGNMGMEKLVANNMYPPIIKE